MLMEVETMLDDVEEFRASSERDRPSIQKLNDLLRRAAAEGVSDVHIENEDGDTSVVRFRHHGVLKTVMRVERQEARLWDIQVRGKSKMVASDRVTALDGRFKLSIGNRKHIDFRVSIIPTRCGQSLVCRLLDSDANDRTINDLYLTEPALKTVREALHAPEGLFLVTGPTGSGKTSTLYACLKELNNEGTKVVTIEDPVEYSLPGAQQIEIRHGMSFARALRGILRQDPDVIMVGEVRDSITAHAAIEAGMTGHQVLSTLHTVDTASTLIRMMEMEVDPYTLGQAARCVLAQRLLRRLCPECRTEAPIDDELTEWLDSFGYSGPGRFMKGAGCEACGFTGETGRAPIFEVLVADQEVRRALSVRDINAIRESASRQRQFETLAQAGIRMAEEGVFALSRVREIVALDQMKKKLPEDEG